MWIATNRGFLSVVTADPKRLPKDERMHRRGARPDGKLDFLCVRARNKAHLEALFPHNRVYEFPGRDYPARIFIDRFDFAEFMTKQVEAVTYDNFKSSVKDGPLHDAYMAVWSVMHRYQHGGYDRPRGSDPGRQHDLYDRFDTRPFNEQVPDDEPCTTPGCTDLNPCLDCIIDAMGDDPRTDEELLEAADDKWRAQADEGDRYGPYDTGDDRDLDDGAASHERIPPR